MEREYALDSLRGFAALIVLISHTTIAGLYNVEPIWSILKWSPLRIFWAGHQAVILFFVLSGFALTCMLYGDKKTYKQYILARIFRLYPTYIMSIIIAIIVYSILENTGLKWENGWFNVIKPNLSINNLIQHIFIVGHFETNTINPPIWSIIYEMRISIIFPLIYILVQKYDKYAVIIMVFISTIIAIIWKIYPQLNNGIINDIMKTFHYSTFFFIGSWIAFNKKQLKLLVCHLSNKTRIVILIVSLFIFSYPFDNPWNQTERALGDIAISLGVLMLMLLAMSSSILNNKTSQWLGKISYSLYLNHILVLNASLILFMNKLGAPIVWIFTVSFSLFLAFIINKLVEQPSINLSRKLFSKS